MSSGLYSGQPGLSLGTGLYRTVSGLWSGASGLTMAFGGPVLSLNFLSGTLDSRITFTRSSSATRVNASGVIESVTANTPRFDYDPVTLAPKGLLVEEQRTNLLLRSEEFDNASWSKIEASVTANAAISPDGTADAEKFIPSTNAAGHYVSQSVTSTTTQCTGSVYVKLDGSAVNKITLFSGSSGTFANFNLSNLSSSGEANVASTSITNVGNGWYRLSATWVAGITVTALRIYASSGTFGAAPVAGDGTSGIFIWGAQLEAGAFATSYIPTVASQVTRTADIATITGANFSQWYNQSEGTFVVGYQAEALVSIDVFMANAGAPLTNSIGIYNTSGTNDVGWCRVAGATQAAINGSVVTTTAHKSAFAYATNNFAFSTAGGSAGTDTSGTLPAPDRLTFGANNISSNSQGMWLRSLTYYNTRLSNAQLQAITS